VLANDFNPFPEVPLRVIAAEVDQADVGSSASVSFTSEGITVRTGASFTGTLSVIYRIQDATKDPARETQGRATIIVRAAPDAPNAPTVVAGDASADVTWKAPASNNSPITDYVVEYNGRTATFPASAAGVAQPISGLTNGTTYTFTVRAVNAIGSSAPSAGTSGTPYGTPNAPQITSFTASGDAPADLTARWNVPTSTGGGGVTYEWRLDGGGWNATSSRSATINNRSAGTYRIEVRAINTGSGRTGPADAAAVGVSNPPKVVSLSKGTRVGYYSGQYGYCGGDCWQYNVSVSGFPDGTASGYAVCNGSQLATNIRISVNNGRGSYTGKFPEAWCGYENAYVVIDGVRSNTW
jgi:large repetitive protein